MTEPQAAQSVCDHAYEVRMLGGHPLSVRLCTLCRTPDWRDLYEQAETLFRWGREEGLAGKPTRATISAYDRPTESNDKAPGYRPEDDDPDVLRERADRAERQVEQAKAVAAMWHEAAARKGDATILAGVAGDVLMAALDRQAGLDEGESL